MSNRIEVTIDKRKLDEIRSRGGKAAVRRALGELAYIVEGEAKRSMEGPKTGLMYFRGGVAHQASAEGEAPAVDTGNLKNSIHADAIGDGSQEWVVSVGAEYGADLEFGTPEIAPRPYMRPAAEQARQRTNDVFEAEFDRL